MFHKPLYLSQNKQNINFALKLLILALFCFPLAAQAKMPAFPKFSKELTIYDQSNRLDDLYMAQVEAQLRQYPYEVRAVFLPNTKTVSLANYARKLYEHWQLPPDQMVLAIALDRRKIGVYLGPELQKQLEDSQASERVIPVPDSSKDPKNPVKKPQEKDYLDKIPQVIDELSQSLSKNIPHKDASQPPTQFETDPLAETPVSANKQGNLSEGRQTQSLQLKDFFYLYVVFGVFFLGVVGWFGFKFLRKRQENRAFIDKYSLNGHAVYGELESIYDDLEELLPSFHGYHGETHEKLGLFVKNITQMQDDFDDIFDEFDEEVAHLGEKENQEDAVAFFHDLEQKRDEGQSLLEQAELVLDNLENMGDNNVHLIEQAMEHEKTFKAYIHETKKLHPTLLFTHTFQELQALQQRLNQYKRGNAKDPMGIAHRLKNEQKKLSQLERDARSLPHLWQQFDGDIKNRIAGLSKMAREGKTTPAQNTQIKEVQALYKRLTQAISLGDFKTINKINQPFTQKLQNIEADI